MTDNPRYFGVKISEEAKVAGGLIRDHHKPDMEMQELYSLAVMEYLHAFYPHLEPLVQTLMESRQAARRGDEEEHPEPE